MADTTILITTRNRPEDIVLTVSNLLPFIDKGVQLLIYDDASFQRVEDLLPSHQNIIIYREEIPSGYLKARNFLMSVVKSSFAVIIDDDAHFLLLDFEEKVENHFNNNPRCGAITFRIYWGHKPPEDLCSKSKFSRVRSFVGCGHAFRLTAWRDIKSYPEWYLFYGEEEYASLKLFKKNWQVHYLPQVLVQHRVNNKERAKNEDYGYRIRRSLSAGWYNYFLFAPFRLLVRRVSYSAFHFINSKVLNGKFSNTRIFLLSVADIFLNFKKILKNRKPLTLEEFSEYESIGRPTIYWTPESDSSRIN